MKLSELKQLHRNIVENVIFQGRRIERHVESGSVPKQKMKTSLGDLVTSLDEEIEHDLKIYLTELLPEASFLGEESLGSTSGTFSWVVDPIDGTTNVIHGVRYAGVSVALLEGNTTLIGVVYSVFENAVYSAISGQGAYRQAAEDGAAKPARIRVSSISSLKDSLLSFGLPYDRAKSDQVFAAASSLFRVCQDLHRNGSAALDLVGVALGTSEGHFEMDLRLWDVAAAALVLVEAGGVVTTWTGDPLDFSEPDGSFTVLASNASVHTEVVSRLQKVAST